MNQNEFSNKRSVIPLGRQSFQVQFMFHLEERERKWKGKLLPAYTATFRDLRQANEFRGKIRETLYRLYFNLCRRLDK